MSIPRILVGLILSGALGWLAYRRGSLTAGGVLGAVVVGTTTFGFGGLTWGVVLIAFFVSSTVLSHYQEGRKAQVADKFAKGQRRDLVQTLANGGFGALLALAVLLLVDLAGQPRSGNPVYIYLTLAYFGAMASVNADTWATELGVLSQVPPRLITTGRPVAPGTSGGISWLGILASLSGSLFIGLVAFGFIQVAALVGTGAWLISDWPVIWIAGLAGLIGSLVDSLLGATVQRVYWCERCGKETEQPRHACGAETRPLRGWGWLDNDRVNFLASVVGGLLSGWLGLVILS